LVGDFGGVDGTKSLKVFSKPSTQAHIFASEKRREVRVWRLLCLTEKGRGSASGDLCVWHWNARSASLRGV